jgi:hypothetical protein
MRRWAVIATLALALFLVPAMEARMGEALFTDRRQDVGVVTRCYFHIALTDDAGVRTWHYFGSDPKEFPPNPNLPGEVYEYDYVQFPGAFDYLGDEMQMVLFDMARVAAENREGLTGPSDLWTPEYEDAGVQRVLGLYMWMAEMGEWHYFGVSPDDYPPDPRRPGTVYEHASVQFPRDWDELGEQADPLIFHAAMEAGLEREELQ